MKNRKNKYLNKMFSFQRPSFSPKRVLILSKITRFEFEKRVHSDIDDKQLESLVSVTVC